MFDGAQMSIHEWDSEWNRLSSTPYTLVDANLAPHDFALTASYYVFFTNRQDLDILPFIAGIKGPAECVSCSDAPVLVYLIPRADGKRAGDAVKVISTGRSFFQIHHATAHEDLESGEVTVYTGAYRRVRCPGFGSQVSGSGVGSQKSGVRVGSRKSEVGCPGRE
jgi:all-trans-8'-apo-beta-carotenal 15,15'-oxygenase